MKVPFHTKMATTSSPKLIIQACLIIVVFQSTIPISMSFSFPTSSYSHMPRHHPYPYPSVPSSPSTLPNPISPAPADTLPQPEYSPAPAPESFPFPDFSPGPAPGSFLPEFSPGPAPVSYLPELSPEPAPESFPLPEFSPGPAPESFPSEPISPAEPPIQVGSPVPGPDYLPPPHKPRVSHPIHRPRRGIRAAYWPSFGSFPASAVDTTYFSHIYYAFLLPDPKTYKLKITSLDMTQIPKFIKSLQNKYPPVKTLLSIGGGGNDPKVFSEMASSRRTRKTFIKSTIKVARRYGFDGIDLDWEFPANDEDMENLALLYKEWRRALILDSITGSGRNRNKARLLLTSAVYFSSRFLFDNLRSYPVKVMGQTLDWVNPMCFDYHGSWENFTGLHSSLNDRNSNISTTFGIGSWINSGMSAHKIVMGLPLYGRTWKLENPDENGVGAPTIGVGPGDGVLVYSQIVEFNKRNKVVPVLDEEAASFYSYSGDSWIGYEDVLSIRIKVRFARSLGLGGYFFWALGQDKDWTISSQASNTWNRG
ncbi:class V chitinase CHIT5a-like isoform X1 [Cannabis sativa]|uniref:class V chitinase CHIT5a-like isoform X1 n=1 Tax=Cannabis sativa TaxID=3483 RepID=UPI0029CA5DE4|nr:class V chitinase CHIT5a-like isoform X1 [Cannabis sativa]